jgi:hypothetical protein
MVCSSLSYASACSILLHFVIHGSNVERQRPGGDKCLARLLLDTDRRDKGRAMLTEIYNWFTEGFDTADLRDAKALLVDLQR